MQNVQNLQHPPYITSSSAQNTKKVIFWTDNFSMKSDCKATKQTKQELFLPLMKALYHSYQQNSENLKSMHFWRSYWHFIETRNSSKIAVNFMAGVHSNTQSWQRAGLKRIMGLFFSPLGILNAPQQVKFHIHDMASYRPNSI